jgi:hypothetical protein
MKLKLIVPAICLFFAGSTAFASTYYIPHVAIGAYIGSDQQVYRYRTTFVFFNNTDTDTNVSMVLTDDNGDPMAANISAMGMKSSTFNFKLGSGATNIFQADSAGNVHTGAATIISDSDIGVSGIYTISNVATGAFVTEVGVPATSLMSNFAIPVQTTSDGFVNTGLALYNPNASDSTITLTLKNEDGTATGANVQFTLAAAKHEAFYITAKYPSIDKTAFSGMLTVQSSQQISALTLRQNSPSTVSYTSIPAVPTASTQKTFNMAHIADGVIGTPYKTTFILFNFSSSAATVSIAATKDDGSALTLAMTDGSTTASNITIPAQGSKFLQTNGAAGSTGAAIITSNVPIGAAALFAEYNNDQSFNTEAGVQDSAATTSFTLPIDSRVSTDGTETISDTGIAFFNPGSSSVTFSPIFMDLSSVITTSSTEITLQAKGHSASFFNNLFPNLGDVQGSVVISGLSSAVSAMALRMNQSPLGITTLPVLSGAATGNTPATSGNVVRKRLGGVIATADTTVNATLPYGYAVTIAPTVTGGAVWASGGLGVRAFSGGNIYTTTTSGAGYTTNLPPGSYEFKVETYVGTQTSAFFWFYIAPSLVTISSNATVPIAATFPTLYAVTGNISGLTTTAGKVLFTSTDGSGSYGYNSVGASPYSIMVPSGTYQVAYATTWPNGPFISNLGTVTVADAETSGPDIEIPTSASLSGTAHFTDTAPASITIAAKNSDGITPPGQVFNVTTATAASGLYQQLKVTPGDLYDMSLAYTLFTTTTADGINCGGSASDSFAADQYYSGGTTYTNSNFTLDMSQITENQPPAAVFNTERYGAMTYTIPSLTAGNNYTVTLYFVEKYVTAAGQRLFSVSINGTTVLSSFDIYATAGGQYKAIAQTFSATADSSGQLVIQFTSGTQNPSVNAIRLGEGIQFPITQGTVNYMPIDNPNSFAGDDAYDFTLPGIPGNPSLITISGTVTNGAGTAVSGVTVTATSSLLTNATAPGASYTSAGATTGADGKYSLKVVPGSDYMLTFAK